MDYSNILNALNACNALTSPTSDVAAENYRVFDELQRKGVRLKDLVDRAESPTDPAVFKAMEQAVGDNEEVVSAREGLEAAREAALRRLLASDGGYIEADRRYRDAVTKAYVKPRPTDL